MRAVWVGSAAVVPRLAEAARGAAERLPAAFGPRGPGSPSPRALFSAVGSSRETVAPAREFSRWWGGRWKTGGEGTGREGGSPPEPRPSPKPERVQAWGRSWNDPFAWLERDGQARRKALAAEQRAFDAWMDGSRALREELLASMLSKAPASSASPPELLDGYWYYTRADGSRPLPAFFRRAADGGSGAGGRGAGGVWGAGDAGGKVGDRGAGLAHHTSAGSLPSEEVVVVDLNDEAEFLGLPGLSLVQLKISRCGGKAAWLVDPGDGSERTLVFSRWLEEPHRGEKSGRTPPTQLGRRRRPRLHPAMTGAVSIEWAGDASCGLLFTLPDPKGRPCGVWWEPGWEEVWGRAGEESPSEGHAGGREAGRGPSAATTPQPHLLHEDDDESFFVDVGRTKDWKFTVLSSHSKRSSEVRVVPTSHFQRARGGEAPDGGGRREGEEGPRPLPTTTLLRPRQPGLEYFLEHAHGRFFLLSNLATGEFGQLELFEVADGERPGGGAGGDWMRPGAWGGANGESGGRGRVGAATAGGEGGVAAAAGERGTSGPLDRVVWEDIDVTSHALVLYGRGPDGRSCVGIARFDRPVTEPEPGSGGRGEPGDPVPAPALLPPYLIPLPSWATHAEPGANPWFDSSTLRLLLASPLIDGVAVDWDLVRGCWLGEPGGPEADERGAPVASTPCHVGTIWASNPLDGVRVPVTVVSMNAAVARRALRGGGSPGGETAPDCPPLPPAEIPPPREGDLLPPPPPALVEVYGSYGTSLNADRRAEREELLRRGWTIALVHVRGGGELGRPWRAAGSGEGACLRALDLRAALEALGRLGLARPSSTALFAASAGAVPAAGAVALAARDGRPLARALVLESPFLDLRGAMSDPSLPLTIHEYDEWGRPDRDGWWDRIEELCPYSATLGLAGYGFPRRGAARGSEASPDAALLSSPAPHVFPATLITASQTDARVERSSAAKYASALRLAASGRRPGAPAIPAAPPSPPPRILLSPNHYPGHAPHDAEVPQLRAVQLAFVLEAVEG